ncbi:hypothetical protein [Dictyobacter vulcani]|uniref:hypothetical protein n=1 Tax=Dictyobacter vulcani TaxID=2607529 RepID=UPI0013869CD7|nr:hypothetical protein [Dictyobacter vulcani]
MEEAAAPSGRAECHSTPVPGETFVRYQQILRGNVVLARAWSRWLWQAGAQQA